MLHFREPEPAPDDDDGLRRFERLVEQKLRLAFAGIVVPISPEAQAIADAIERRLRAAGRGSA